MLLYLNPNEKIDPWCCKKGINDISPPGPLIINSFTEFESF